MTQPSILSWLTGAKPHLQPDQLPTGGTASHNLREEAQNGVSASTGGNAEILDVQPVQPAGIGWPKASIPANASIEPLTERYVSAFKRLNSLLLPVPYPNSFYVDTLQKQDIAALTKVAVWYVQPQDDSKEAGRLVGAIRCRLAQDSEHPEGPPSLYISTIGVLSPFRGHSLASCLLATVTRQAIEDYGVTGVMAHVWEENHEGLSWYKARGFRVAQKEADYYRRLAPKSAAFLMRREVGPRDLLEHTHPLGTDEGG